MNLYNKLSFDLQNKIDNIFLSENQKHFNLCLFELNFLFFIDKIIKELYINYKYETYKYTILYKDNKKIYLYYEDNCIKIIKNNKKKFYINLDKYNIFNIRKHKELIYYLYNLFKQKFKLDSFQ